MNSQSALIAGVAAVARAWMDPEYVPRAAAVTKTLAADNRFTEEALAFAINQHMSLLTEPALSSWLGDSFSGDGRPIGVVEFDDVPLSGLQDWLAVVLTGRKFQGVVPAGSPYLLPAFSMEVGACCAVPAEFVSYETMLTHSVAVIANGDESALEQIRFDAGRKGIGPDCLLCRSQRYGIAIIDGRESEDERMRLAEDVLLHEGRSRFNAGIIWAPRDRSPDPYLDAFAVFRSVFPAHEKTPGALKMKQAFLQAVGVPHAHADDLAFLVSKGDPEFQEPGHIRWAEYDTLDDVATWLSKHEQAVEWVAINDRLQDLIKTACSSGPPGMAHRPALTRPRDGRRVLDFLSSVNTLCPQSTSDD